MKKLIILLVVVCSAASCAKEEIYSCNPEADLWAKSNVTEIQQMTRADFLAIGDLVYQRAAFNAFTPNQKQALWIGKMEEVLKLDWTEQERQHIQTGLELIKINSFIFSNKRDLDAFDTVEVELYKWMEYAQRELGWNKQLLYAIAGTPQVMNADKEIESDSVTFSPRLKSGSEGPWLKCDCQIGVSIISDWCWNSTCKDVGCDWAVFGCGLYWSGPCTGKCWVD